MFGTNLANLGHFRVKVAQILQAYMFQECFNSCHPSHNFCGFLGHTFLCPLCLSMPHFLPGEPAHYVKLVIFYHYVKQSCIFIVLVVC